MRSTECHFSLCSLESADKLARVTPISSTQVIPIPPSDALPTVRNYIRTKWQVYFGFFPKQTLQNIS